MDLDVIIVSHNSARWLEPCLSSLHRHAGGAQLNVVVVDNASSDGSAALVEQAFPQVTVLHHANRGFAAGNNRGLELARAPFTLFLNADTEILHGTLAELLRLLQARPSVGLIGCRQVNADGVLQPTMRRFPSARRYLFEAIGSERLPFRAGWLGERVIDPAAYQREVACDWTSGSFMLARRAAVLQAGGFDEQYFLFSEEPDLCLRMNRLGWEVRHMPAMTILHHAGKAGIDARLVAQDAYSRRQYMIKNMSPVQRRASICAFAFGHLLRAGFVTRDRTVRRARRACSRRAVQTLVGAVPPPFEPSSGVPRR